MRLAPPPKFSRVTYTVAAPEGNREYVSPEHKFLELRELESIVGKILIFR